jgi:CBS domain-containing protein
MKVKDIMTKDVTYINPMSKVTEAAQLMQKHNIGSIPVCDQSGVVGIITDRDIVVRNVAHGQSPQDTIVKDVMTASVSSVTPEMDVTDASEIMAKSQIRRLPVVENNLIVGIISLGDIATDKHSDNAAGEALSDISM